MAGTTPAATPDLLGLPTELRLRIIEDVQHLCMWEADPVSICLYRGPDNTIRQVCRLFYSESEEVFEKARREWSQQRLSVCQAIMANAAFTLSSIAVPWGPEASRIKDLYLGLRHGQQLATCTHTCLRTFHHWHQCNNWRHIDCLTCGRWASLAVYCFMRPEQMPDLIVRADGVYGARLTFIGHLLERLSRQLMHSRTVNIPQMWWRLQLEKQKNIDRRVAIYREAISRCQVEVNSKVDGHALSSDEEPIGMTRGAVEAMVASFERRFYAQELKAFRLFQDEYCDEELDWRAEWLRQREVRKARARRIASLRGEEWAWPALPR